MNTEGQKRRNAVSEMPPPNKAFTNMLKVKRVLYNGRSARSRREIDGKLITALGSKINSKYFKKEYHQGKFGKYGASAFALNQTIERSRKRAEEAAIAKAEAEETLKKEATLQKEAASLQQILGGYKKVKPKPKSNNK
jgi:ribosomal protein S2